MYKYIHVYLYICIYMYVCMYVCMYIYMYICTYIYIHIYIYMNTYIHIDMQSKQVPQQFDQRTPQSFACAYCTHVAADGVDAVDNARTCERDKNGESARERECVCVCVYRVARTLRVTRLCA